MSQYTQGYEVLTDLIKILAVSEDEITGRLIGFFRRYHELVLVCLPDFLSHRLNLIEKSVGYPDYEAFIVRQDCAALRKIAEQIFQAYQEFTQELLSE